MFTYRFAPHLVCRVAVQPEGTSFESIIGGAICRFGSSPIAFTLTTPHGHDPTNPPSVRERPTRRLWPACRGLMRGHDVVGIEGHVDHDRQAEARRTTKCRLGVRRTCSLEYHSVT